jgi:glucosamine 6-phosphate synthetase-like amidotransferase/phosphosugar isomerase protein
LLSIEERGRDACGGAWRNYDNLKEIVVRKHAINASKWMNTKADELTVNASSAVLHTRYATQGSPDNALNNHPVCANKLALVHNGHVFNDDELFKRLNVRRRGQVDSEAIVALLAFGSGSVADLLPQIQGGASVAWLDATDRANVLHVARVRTSPLHVAQTERGSFLFASTKHAVEHSARKVGLKLSFQWDVPEGTYLKIRDGRIVEEQSFTVREAYSYGSYYTNWNDYEYGLLEASQGSH